jgi:hypothetical protein
MEQPVRAAFVQALAVAVRDDEGKLASLLASLGVVEVGEGDGDVGLDFGGPGAFDGELSGRRCELYEEGARGGKDEPIPGRSVQVCASPALRERQAQMRVQGRYEGTWSTS